MEREQLPETAGSETLALEDRNESTSVSCNRCWSVGSETGERRFSAYFAGAWSSIRLRFAAGFIIDGFQQAPRNRGEAKHAVRVAFS